MKTLIALLAITLGLSFTSVQARESISTQRTQDLSWHHHHHHHGWWRHHYYHPY